MDDEYDTRRLVASPSDKYLPSREMALFIPIEGLSPHFVINVRVTKPVEKEIRQGVEKVVSSFNLRH